MKRIHTLKRTIALFLAMLMAATSTAFADWDSFQGNSDNNGISEYGVTEKSDVLTVTLPNDGATTGLDVEPLVYGSRIYAFHNSGKNGPVVTAVDATDGSVLWSKAVSSGVVEKRDYIANVSQVSTPVIDTDGENLYGVYTYNVDRIYGAQTDFYPVTLAVNGGKATASYTGINIPADYTNLQLDTNLVNPAYHPDKPEENLTGTATLTNRETGKKYTFSGSSYEDQNFSLYYSGYPDGPIPAGSYDLEVTLTNNTSLEVVWRRNRLYTTAWKMFGLSGIDGTDPAPISSIDLSGNGQSASPLTLVNNKVYFGIFDADCAYFQYDLSTGDSAKFVPGNGNSFYYAGAAVIGSNVIFGSEDGTVYMRPVDNFADGQGDESTLTNAGRIRSSICYDGSEYIYLTSYNGYLWRISVADGMLSNETFVSIGQGGATNSTSTPTVTENGMVYAGIYGYDADYNPIGAVVAVAANEFTAKAPKVTSIYTGDAVQSSPVVYYDEDNGDIYVYFTTNVSNGTGYCYNTKSVNEPVWKAESGNYALQGFAMGENDNEDAFGVFGNDGCQLMIVTA